MLNYMGQLIVVMFLVYSGYGIMESFRRKRGNYLKGFLRKRVLKTLVHFNLAVLLFLVLALFLEHKYPVKAYAWSWTGWTSIGNSNWFVFDIIILYLLSYLGLIIVKRKDWSERTFLWIIFALCCGFLLFMLKTKQLWWYDTILAYPVGMLWSVYREQIEDICRDSRKYWLIFTIVLICFVVCLWGGRNYKAVFLFIASPLFGILVMLITMKLRIGNAVLHWLGVNAFAIYILQRLPMIIASEYCLNESPVTFMLIIIPATLLIAAAFTSFTKRLDLRLFS